MGFSRELTASLAKYVIGKRLRGAKRFPLVLMLEPTFKCNLACAGCGRIREYRDIADVDLSVAECLEAVDESGAPVVSITGGEPLVHPQIEQIVRAITERKRFVNLCTNGILLERSLAKFEPGPRLSFVLHLDSLAESHDRFAGRTGVFDTALSAIKAAADHGFQVLINTTIYKTTNLSEIKQLFSVLKQTGVAGIMITPGFSYEAVASDIFLSRQEAVAALRPIVGWKGVPYYNTPGYLDFLAGKRELACRPWSTPTRNPKGWKRPCYLITDGHCGTFSELMDETDWSAYGAGRDPRCANCMVHCGFEADAVAKITRSPSDFWKTVRWCLSG